MRYANTHEHRLMWLDLQDEEGRTLELDPGEQVELDGEVVDPWLKPVDTPQPEPQAVEAETPQE